MIDQSQQTLEKAAATLKSDQRGFDTYRRAMSALDQDMRKARAQCILND